MNRLVQLITIFCLFLLSGDLIGQSETTYDTTIIHQDGRVMRIRITGKDTVVVATMPEVVIKRAYDPLKMPPFIKKQRQRLIELRSAHAIDQNCGLCMISNDQINELVAAFRPITALADRLNG